MFAAKVPCQIRQFTFIAVVTGQCAVYRQQLLKSDDENRNQCHRAGQLPADRVACVADQPGWRGLFRGPIRNAACGVGKLWADAPKISPKASGARGHARGGWADAPLPAEPLALTWLSARLAASQPAALRPAKTRAGQLLAQQHVADALRPEDASGVLVSNQLNHGCSFFAASWA